MLLKLAWRNLWRNRTRTLITMGLVFFAVILSSLMMSLKEGIYTKIVDSAVGAYSGYAQVHAAGYWEERSMDLAMDATAGQEAILAQTKGLSGFVPRIESLVLAASDANSKASLIVGINPEKEKELTALDQRVTAGTYLATGDKAVMIGSGLADYLKITVGDTIVVLGQGYHGINAAGKYPVKGIVKFGSPELSKQLIFLPLAEAQWLFGMEGLYTNLILYLDNPRDAEKIAKQLKTELGENYEAMAWQELSPDIIKLMETDRKEGYVFMFILYMVISFGIFGTMLMMLAERQYEFGVLVAIGMKRIKLGIVVFLELFIISILGAFAGMLGAFPVCGYFYINPINLGEEMGKAMEEFGMEAVLQASLMPSIFLMQGAVVAIISIVIALYSLFKLMRLHAVTAMRT